MMRKSHSQFEETLPWNPWKEHQNAVYGSLESLPRSVQHDKKDQVQDRKYFNPWVFLTVFGGGALSVMVLIGILAMMVMKWSQSSISSINTSQHKASEQISGQRSDGDDVVSVEQDFTVVKSKIHEFFTRAEHNETFQPLVITEDELNAILKHDKRLGVLHDTITARIKDGRIQTAFDIHFGGGSFFGGVDGRLKGIGTFRVGLYANELKVAVESLKVNNRSVSRWLHYVHNMGVGDLAKSGVKKLANVPLRLLGKSGFRTVGNMQPILTTLHISKASTGNVFESISFQGDGVLNMFAEPVQLFAINELFDVHSRLRDLVKSLDRVEVADGVIMLYPRPPR